MLRRHESPAVDVALVIGPSPLYPGAELHAEVCVTPRRDFVAARGLLRLESVEILRIDSARDAILPRPARHRSGRHDAADRDRNRNPNPNNPGADDDAALALVPAAPIRIDHIFAVDTPMPAGLAYRYPACLTLPVRAAPTVKGRHARITWQLTATVTAAAAGAGAGILAGLTGDTAGRAARELVVFAGPEAPHLGGVPLPERPCAVRAYRQLTLALALDAGRIPNGGVITGRLTAQPAAGFRAREVRVELVRWERSGSRQAGVTESRQVLQRPAVFAAGETARWPFRLPVPTPLMPSVLAQHTFIGWQVRAVIARTLRFGLNVTQPVQIYTAPVIEGSVSKWMV